MHTREDYNRFDEYSEFIPYKPTDEELAKKDEIKKVLEQELSNAYEPDPMDDYAGYDCTEERIDAACERVAKQFNVDTDFVDQIAGEIQNETNEMNFKEWEWANTSGNLTSEQYEQYMNGELDIRPLMSKDSHYTESSRQTKFSEQYEHTDDEYDSIVDDYINKWLETKGDVNNVTNEEIGQRRKHLEKHVRDIQDRSIGKY